MIGTTIMIGETIAHYQITARIGAGGMGEVYGADSSTSRARASQCLGCEYRRPARIFAA
jgi:hypothetical protein